MIRNLLATTAIATLLASGAYAQTTAPATDPGAGAAGDPAATQAPMVIRAEGHLASNIIGETVYNGTGEDAENIGEVKDLILDQEGNIEAIVVGVGGFLGIGQKEVALEYDLLQWAEQEGDRYIVVETTEDALRAQEEFDRAAYRPMPADADVAETKPATAEDLAAAPAAEEGAEGEAADETAMAPADEEAGDMAAAPADEEAGDMAAAPADEGAGETTAAAPTDEEAGETTAAAPLEEPADDTTAAAPAEEGDTDVAVTEEPIAEEPVTEETAAATEEQQAGETDPTQTAAVDRNTLQEAQPDQIRAENLIGTQVYGANEEDIGEIGDVVLTPEGNVDAIIVDVGGFLGLGEKEVAISIENLAFMTDEDGDLYLYTEFTQEELEAQPEFDQATYAEQRDEMLLQMD